MGDVDIVEFLIMGVMVVGVVSSFVVAGMYGLLGNIIGLGFYFSGTVFLIGFSTMVYDSCKVGDYLD